MSSENKETVIILEFLLYDASIAKINSHDSDKDADYYNQKYDSYSTAIYSNISNWLKN